MNGQQVFIGSSRERKNLAIRVAKELSKLDLVVLPWWSPMAFRPGDITLARLIQLANLCEAAVLIFGGDDKLWFRPDPGDTKRRKPTLAVRDNVLLEYGLFVGSAGLKHTVIVAEEGVKLPSDLNGVTVIFFDRKDTLIRTATRVAEYFKDLLDDELERAKFSDSSMIISTDWTMEIHRIQVNRLMSTKWNPSHLYAGQEGALAWSKVESDPTYSGRTQTNLNGRQIAGLIGNHKISTVVSLGPGLGTVDAELIANLKSKTLREYVPVDVNHFLLLQSAKNVAGKNAGVECKRAIMCDFDFNTSFVGQIISNHCPSPRLFLMAGGTFGNSRKTEQSLLGSLYQIMNKGDIFVFDLFCFGSAYDVNEDPMFNKGQWPTAIQSFFANGIRKLTNDRTMQDREAIRRLSPRHGNISGLSKTIEISICDSQSNISLVGIRRFDANEIKRAIVKAGFKIGKSKKVSIGSLERHVLLAKK